MSLRDEIENNYQTFSSSWAQELTGTIANIASREKKLIESYVRLTSLQSWRTDVLEHSVPPNCLGFFLEAQNDALISHVNAACGGWRIALKSLRSCIENTMLALYYKDHPVELEQWSKGTFRIGFTDLSKYFQKHPLISELPKNFGGLKDLETEYAQLSRAVHASSLAFRMTAAGQAIEFWNPDILILNQWAAREKKVLLGLNLLLLALFSSKLTGTQNSNLRKSIAFTIPQSKDASIRTNLHITIKRSS